MGRTITRLWTAVGGVLSGLVAAGLLLAVGAWFVGHLVDDEDLGYHGTASLLFLGAYLPWFVPHYVARPSLTGLLVPFVGLMAAPFLFALLALFTMETPGVTAHVRIVVVVTGLLAPVASTVWFVARCRRRWARLVALADATPGGRLAEVVAVVPHGPWRVARLVDDRTDEREEVVWWGRVRRGEVCVVDGALNVVEREAPIVRGFGRSKPSPATRSLTKLSE